MDLKEKAKQLPACPGVYLMKDSQGSIIYVGKSKCLKNRVGSYFQNSKAHPPKVVKMVRHLKDFEYITTDTEFEALMLECKLIQEIRPLYNRLMKSPEAYTYIRITINEEYPDIQTSKECKEDDGCLYFGPYARKSTVERGIQGIRECCKILCSGNSRKASPCLSHSLGLCMGACLGSTPREQYLAVIERIIGLLNGTDSSILDEMKHQMEEAAERLDFEGAAKCRDYLRTAGFLVSRHKMIEYTENNKNIAVLERIAEDSVKFFLIKGNRLLFSEKYRCSLGLEALKPTLKGQIEKCFADEALKTQISLGKDDIDEAQIIYSYLKSSSSDCKHAVIPDKWLLSRNSKALDKALDKLLNGI